jgi:hypothetical protein
VTPEGRRQLQQQFGITARFSMDREQGS